MTLATWFVHPTVQALGEALLHFIWQGSLLALLLWLLKAITPAARFRYGAATLIMLTMLVSFVITVGLGISRKQARNDAAALRAVSLSTSHSLIYSSTEAGHARVSRKSSTSLSDAGISGWAVGIWVMGVLVLSLRAVVGWIGIQNLRSTAIPASYELDILLTRLKSRLGVSAPVRLYTSAIVRVPTVFGCLRHYILLPVTVLTGLSESQMEAILAHELAHIRRHDYLVNVIQTVIETVLFYHPAVWWVGAQMRLEREHCCDDIAVAACGNAFQYASALAEMELIRDRIPDPALAVTGGGLPARIHRLLDRQKHPPRSPGIVAAGSLMLLIAVATAIVSMYAVPRARAASERPAFEAALIKPSKRWDSLGGIQILPGGRLAVKNTPPRILIMTAYGIEWWQISFSPVWANMNGYDIEAKAPEDQRQGFMKSPVNGLMPWGDLSDSGRLPREMLQTLLETQFRLQYHWVTQQQPVYELTGNGGGPNIKNSQEGSCVRFWPDTPIEPLMKPGDKPLCGIRGITREGFHRKTEMAGATMAELAGGLSSELGSVVIDRTGLIGTFDLSLQWMSAGPEWVPESNVPSILTAIQEQLGLKLEPATGPVRVMVIDNIEKPAEN